MPSAPRPVPPTTQPAVLLNANARGVGPKTPALVQQALPGAAVFCSHSLAEAHVLAEKILAGAFSPVLLGGGDGTLMGFLQALLAASHKHSLPLPELGLLRLGTGNAIARWTGQTQRGHHALRLALQRMALNSPRQHKPLNLVEFEGQLAPFAGVGLDGRVLGDYVRFKAYSSRKIWKYLATGLHGYAASVLFRTLPHFCMHSAQIRCEIRNLGQAQRVCPDGSVGPPLPRGALLFEGLASMAAVSTIPFYGYGIRMFPFAERLPRRMHLRVIRHALPRLLLNLRGLWNGRWFPEGMEDFVVDDVAISCAHPMPCQVGGEATQARDNVRFQLSATSVPLVDFGASTPA